MTNLNMIFHVVVSLYRLVKLWNSPQFPDELRNGQLQLCFTELRKKTIVFLYQDLIMRCYVTIFTEIYGIAIFFGSGPRLVNRTQFDPGFVNPIRSNPVLVLETPKRKSPSRKAKKTKNHYWLWLWLVYSLKWASYRSTQLRNIVPCRKKKCLV